MKTLKDGMYVVSYVMMGLDPDGPRTEITTEPP
jgi:hypothetical protein